MLQRSLQLAEERAFQAKLAWEKELLQDPRLLMFKADLESMAAERMHYYQALRTAKQEAAGLRWTIDELRAHNAVLKQNAHDLKEALAAAQLDVASAMDRVHELQEQVPCSSACRFSMPSRHLRLTNRALMLRMQR